ncbi:hypothetical protein OCH239_00335 [Roseivivax halodurans JCM 10272]|uniref:Flagellar FliJ protein n=1 Tax=Roseivivax halodurans JCM 10272 TaxID=1449350 RepID=X7ENC5_9RHOB|nr:hypothetical protein [Roseivivax halodurans]ETX16706.1 hypothetical protein OCH239_00335 [Roseivivax halodurans JCM 10272]
MTDTRRRRSIALIERLARDRAKAAAREHATLDAEHARLVAERDDVLASLVDYPALPDAAAARYVAGWIRSVSAHADHLAQDAARTRVRCDEVARQAADEFREAETYRHLIDRIDAAGAERERAAEIELLSAYLTKQPRTD